jgi:Tol biopolymer transport system component
MNEQLLAMRAASKGAIKMEGTRYRCVLSIMLLLAFAGCTSHENPQALKEKTARATEEVKRDAKAVAAGIREGWSRDKPLDLNAANKEQLLSLPGVTSAQGNRIMANRPYDKTTELLTRRIIPKSEYDKIADLVTIKK